MRTCAATTYAVVAHAMQAPIHTAPATSIAIANHVAVVCRKAVLYVVCLATSLPAATAVRKKGCVLTTGGVALHDVLLVLVLHGVTLRAY